MLKLSNNFKNYLHLHFIVFIWGFTAILGALISIEAVPLVWYRVTIATLFILGYLLSRKISLRVTKKELFRFFLGGVLIAIHWITFFYAIKISNISITLATMSTGALFATLLEYLIYKKKIVFYELFFSILAIVGLVIIFNAEGSYSLGIGIALISAFLSASFSILNADLVKYHSASVISFYELLVSVVFISIILVYNRSFTIDFFVLGRMDWIYMLILASICTAYAFVASTKVLESVSAYTMMLTINLEPIYGILLALLIFNEKELMSTHFYWGALLILSTVILNGLFKYKPNLFKKK